LLQEALELNNEFAPVEKRLRQARKEGLLSSDYLGDQIGEAEKAQVISKAEARNMRAYHDKVLALLAVDDFAPEDLARNRDAVNEPLAKNTAAKKTVRKKVTKKAAKKTSSKKKSA
jgi:L-fucose mutarotase/ribose pyranase (RbsD/FucU family)